MQFFVDVLSVWGPSWNPLGVHFANFSWFGPPILLQAVQSDVFSDFGVDIMPGPNA